MSFSVVAVEGARQLGDDGEKADATIRVLKAGNPSQFHGMSFERFDEDEHEPIKTRASKLTAQNERGNGFV